MSTYNIYIILQHIIIEYYYYYCIHSTISVFRCFIYFTHNVAKSVFVHCSRGNGVRDKCYLLALTRRSVSACRRAIIRIYYTKARDVKLRFRVIAVIAARTAQYEKNTHVPVDVSNIIDNV